VVARGGILAATAEGRPVDLGAGASAQDFATAVDAIIAARQADAVVVLHWPAPGISTEPFAQALVGLAAQRSSYRPARIVAVLLGGARDSASAHRGRQQTDGAGARARQAGGDRSGRGIPG
jgi:acyl-CoA synthetase (NDP forming)